MITHAGIRNKDKHHVDMFECQMTELEIEILELYAMDNTQHVRF